MISLGYVGRETEGKGIAQFISVFDALALGKTFLHVFSDSSPRLEKNIKYHGWVTPNDVWTVKFDFLVLPMIAPETFCFALHEGIQANRCVIVNSKNRSLISQLSSGFYSYCDEEDLKRLLFKFDEGKIPKVETKLAERRRELWRRV